MDIFEEVKNLNFPIGDYLVLGSGPMAARGLRGYKDIDILVTEKLYKQLVNQGWKTVEINGANGKFEVLKNGKFEVDKRMWCGNYKPDVDMLIRSAELINGVPFLPLEELIKFKKALGREKDLKDIELIKKHLENFKKFAKQFSYRKNVGALIKKGDKFMVICYAEPANFWKLPQGGVHEGETKKQALMRELKEEFGTDKFKIIKQFPFSHQYHWDERSVYAPGNKYKGQKQTFFLVEFFGEDSDITLDSNELKDFCWATKDELLKKIDVKHPVFKGYKKLVEKMLK